MKIANIITKIEDFHFVKNRVDNVFEQFFELRMDFDNQLLELLNKDDIDPKKVIITYRSINEGGKGDAVPSIKDIEPWLSLNPGYIDLEVERDKTIIDSLKLENIDP